MAASLLTRDEAAQQFRVSPASIMRYFYDGRLEGVGPVVLVSKKSVEQYQRESGGKVGRPRAAN